MSATEEPDFFDGMNELVACETEITRQHSDADPRGQAQPGMLTPAQQQAALRALHHAGIDDIVIDLRDDQAAIEKSTPDETIRIFEGLPQVSVTHADNTRIDELLFPEFSPLQPKRDVEADISAFNKDLADLSEQYSAKQPPVAAPKQSRFARLRERVGERLRYAHPPYKAIGVVALSGLVLLGGAFLTRGGGSEALQAKQQPAATTTTYEAPTTTSTITVSRPEAAPAIDLSNQATADALGQMIVSFDEIRVQMTPTATEAQIQAAQIQALDYAAALDAASA